jgi:hypothetical protein
MTEEFVELEVMDSSSDEGSNGSEKLLSATVQEPLDYVELIEKFEIQPSQLIIVGVSEAVMGLGRVFRPKPNPMALVGLTRKPDAVRNVDPTTPRMTRKHEKFSTANRFLNFKI